MTTIKIMLDTIDRIKNFNRTVQKFPGDFDLEQGRYYIDAKSMMGLLSLDLSAPVDLHFNATEEEETKIVEALKEYIIEA